MASDALRGTLAEGVQNEITGAISEDDMALVRFHGMYLQDDRDRREERAAKKLERLYSFMIRLRLNRVAFCHRNNGWRCIILPANIQPALSRSRRGKLFSCMAF